MQSLNAYFRLTTTISLFLCLALPAGAQITGTLEGVITDPAGAALPGATVTAESPALVRASATAVTDGTGRYRIPGLNAGTYRVTVVLQGFATAVQEGVVIPVGTSVTLGVQLSLAGVEEQVTVSATTSSTLR